MKANIWTVPRCCLYESSSYGSFPSIVDLPWFSSRQVLPIPEPRFFHWDLAFLCKEGYHGLRCDQFVPKTDAILSDPTDELGIEFMESGDTYQRQVLSIFSIASGICLLGVACMALYRRNKRHREKLQAHFSDSRSLRDCSVNASGLMSKSAPRLQYSLQLQKGCSSHGSSIKGSSVAPGTSTAAPPLLSRALSKGKRF
ncbi:hypothetical protein JOQ06_026577, partial [Pogonophryne albipinna]